MKLKKIFILLINFLSPISIAISSNIELLTFSANITGENFYSENPFSGGYNKPKIQWVDWNNDGFDELFLLDEDGKLKYFNMCNNSNGGSCTLVDPFFQELNCASWFFFGDFDNDNMPELITQSIQNPTHLTYYENYNNILQIEALELTTNLNQFVTSEAVVTPTFADIDNDGDLDFFTGSVNGTLSFYENLGLENNIPVFVFRSNHWQDITIIGQSISTNRHGASAISFIDLDSDGDLDLTWGDYFQQSLYVVWNIGNNSEPHMNLENIVNNFPESPYTIETSGQNMPTFSDIDNDGDMDLFVTVLGGTYGFQTINNFYHFENIGNASNITFIEKTRNFLNCLDFNDNSSPVLVDIDDDGDDDLIIGNSFQTTSFPWNGRLKYLENRGTNKNPEYHIIDENFLGNLIGKDLTPTFVDIDNDGDLDIFVGETYGKVFFAENIGNSFQHQFNDFVNFLDIDVGYNSVPAFVDIDNDSDYDLFIGNSLGNLIYYKNIGSANNHNFALENDNFFNISVNGKSSPNFIDFDNDNDFDILVGSEYSGIYLYENTGDNEFCNFTINEEFPFPIIGNNLKITSNQSTPFINNLIIGNKLGGLFNFRFSICGSGDFDGDSILNINDIYTMVNIVVNGNINGDSICQGDSNLDGLLTILDILNFINDILN